VALFERTSFGIGPTREAERLALRAQLAFAELAQARSEVGALTGGAAGRTVIGAMPLARSYLVPTAVLAFASAHPRHSVSILDGTYESLLAALRTGQADVLIGALRGPAPAEDVREERLFDDPLALVVRAGHPLTRGRAPSVRELPRFEWIAPRAGSPLRRQFNELFQDAGLAVPACPIECSSLVAARAILVDSDRVMLLSAHQVQQDVAAGMLVALPHPRGRVTRAIGLTMRSAWRPTAEQLDLLRAVRKVAAELDAVPRGSARRRPGRSSGPGD
jgi:DNA-binding transcriptional LysR family regulator